jgi:hypothetical protein
MRDAALHHALVLGWGIRCQFIASAPHIPGRRRWLGRAAADPEMRILARANFLKLLLPVKEDFSACACHSDCQEANARQSAWMDIPMKGWRKPAVHQ